MAKFNFIPPNWIFGVWLLKFTANSDVVYSGFKKQTKKNKKQKTKTLDVFNACVCVFKFHLLLATFFKSIIECDAKL